MIRFRYSLLLTLFLFCHGLEGQEVLSFDYESHIVLKARLNGQQAVRLVLDSGADGLYLDSTYFAQTGIKIEQSQQATLPGAGSTPQQITVVMDPLTVNFGSESYSPPYTPLIQLRPILGKDVDGIIGLSFLREYLARLDYSTKELTLYPSESFSIPDDYQSIPLEIRNNRLHLQVQIGLTDGYTFKESFQLDLGNGGTLDISSPTAAKHQLMTRVGEKMRYTNAFGGVGGEIKGYQFRASHITLGDFKINGPVIDYSEDERGALAKAEIGGLLGNKVLERFTLIFDFKDSLLYLKPNGNKEPFESNMSGFSFADRREEFKGFYITGLYEGTQAEEIGLQIGDVITRINGVDVMQMKVKEVRRQFRTKGKALELTLNRAGKLLTKKLVLKGYL